MTTPFNSVYLQSAAFNSASWSSAAGGTIGFSYEAKGSNNPVFCGDALRPLFNPITRVVEMATIELIDVTIGAATSIPIGTKSSLVLTVSNGDISATTKVITLANMKYLGLNIGLSNPGPGRNTLTFVHESSDGITNPETVA
jgi:hypothetical protein